MDKANCEGKIKHARAVLRTVALVAIPIVFPPAMFAVRDMLGCRYNERHVTAYK